MAAFTFTMGGDDGASHYIGYSANTFRSSFTPNNGAENVSGAVGATNKPIVITFMRQVFPTNSGTSARLELDTSSTGTAVYASSYRNCSGNEDVTPNYTMNAGSTVWYGFRTGSSATLYFNQKATTGAADSIIRYNGSTTSTWSSTESLYARLDWYGVPAAPTSPTIDARSSSSVTISWTKNADMGGYTSLTGYRILYKRSSDSTWSSTGKVGDDTTTSYTVTGLDQNITYDFLIAGLNAATDIYNPTYTAQSAVTGTNASISATTGSGGIYNQYGVWVGPTFKVCTDDDPATWTTATARVWTGTEWKAQ